MTHNRTYLKYIKGIELLFIVQMYPFKKFKFLSAKDHKKVAYQSLSLIHSQRLSLSHPRPHVLIQLEVKVALKNKLNDE